MYQGGYKLELLDQDERHLQDLTEPGQFLGLDDAT